MDQARRKSILEKTAMLEHLPHLTGTALHALTGGGLGAGLGAALGLRHGAHRFAQTVADAAKTKKLYQTGVLKRSPDPLGFHAASEAKADKILRFAEKPLSKGRVMASGARLGAQELGLAGAALGSLAHFFM